jgi:CRISPR-associated protein Cmr2
MTDPAHWLDCIRAFLHDPPDKALDVKGHEARAARYQSAAFDVPGDPVREGVVKPADWLASAIERLPLPKGTLRDCDGNELDPILGQPFNRIPREKLQRSSPLDGSDLTNTTTSFRQAQDLSATTVDKRADAIRQLAQANGDHRKRAMALWSQLPEQLPHVFALPGDTRLTDHSIVDHADAAMACCAALRNGQSASLLVFSLGPVQSFIVQGRSLRDLWTGSYLLSWLTFQAMTPILKDLGPWCITSPGLRNSPLLHWWMGIEGVRDANGIPIKAKDGSLRWAGLPNTFTALVPTHLASDFCQRVETACRDGWRAIYQSVHEELRKTWRDSWDDGWKEQCEEIWDVRSVSLPVLTVTDSGSVVEATAKLRKIYVKIIGELPPSVVDASAIAEALVKAGLAPGYVSKEGQGLWPLANELAQRLMEAGKRARRVPAHAPGIDSREKCALFPGFAVMGPQGDTSANKQWWGRSAIQLADSLVGRLRGSERLSAPGLVKRFAFGAFFRELLRIDFPDTREVAFSNWVAQLKASPNGISHWNNWQKTVAGINRRAADELEQRWAEHDLLDEGTMVVGNWLHPAADEAVLREEFKKARNARIKLIGKAKEVGLPEPRPYYAVLAADGDRMGEFLRGERGPRFDQAYHPTMIAKLRELGLSADLLGRVRPQGMAAQLAFSRSLGDFTTKAGETIAKHQGTCVYAGGDDVLAVLPVATALRAAADLALDFRTYVPGATLSVGLAIVHCHEDLRSAIEEARRAEALAKTLGRNCLACTVVRRNGETSSAVASWPLVRDWQATAELLATRSVRWIHHLLEEKESLQGLPMSAFWARAKHHLLHGEEGGRTTKGLGELFDRIRTAWESWSSDDERKLTPEMRVDHFLTWCQHAAWLAKFQNIKQDAQS